MRVGLPVILKEYVTGYRPAVRLLRMLERDRWGATVERPEFCDAGECNERKHSELEVEEESEQKSEEKAGGGNLMPEMDRTEVLWSRPGFGVTFPSIRDRARTWKQKPEEPAKRASIAVVVRVGNQKQEGDDEQDERGCATAYSDSSPSYSV